MSKNVFFLNMHQRLGRSLSWMLRKTGYTVFTPEFHFAHRIRGQFHNSFPQDLPGTVQIDETQFKQMKFHTLFLLCYEQEVGNWWQMVRGPHPDTPVVHYSGNDWTPYDTTKMKYFMATTAKNHELALSKNKDVKTLLFRPSLPEEDWAVEPSLDRSMIAMPVVNNFVINLKGFWPVAHREFTKLAELLTPHGIMASNWESLSEQATRNMRWQGLCGIHLKDADGWGHAPLETVAMGMPCLVMKRLANGRAIGRNIRPEDQFDTIEQMAERIVFWNKDRRALHEASILAQQHTLKAIDEKGSLVEFKDFMEQVR